MPGSLGEGKDYIREFVKDNIDDGALFVLDVGAGKGTYADLLGDIDGITIDAVEIYEPYVKMFDLDKKYNQVVMADVRKYSDFMYDLVIFGDVLEHMTREEAIAVFKEAICWSGWVIVSLPIVHWPQGEEFGNPHERHVQEHVTLEDIRQMFGVPTEARLYEHLGVFVYKRDAV